MKTRNERGSAAVQFSLLVALIAGLIALAAMWVTSNTASLLPDTTTPTVNGPQWSADNDRSADETVDRWNGSLSRISEHLR